MQLDALLFQLRLNNRRGALVSRRRAGATNSPSPPDEHVPCLTGHVFAGVSPIRRSSRRRTPRDLATTASATSLNRSNLARNLTDLAAVQDWPTLEQSNDAVLPAVRVNTYADRQRNRTCGPRHAADRGCTTAPRAAGRAGRQVLAYAHPRPHRAEPLGSSTDGCSQSLATTRKPSPNYATKGRSKVRLRTRRVVISVANALDPSLELCSRHPGARVRDCDRSIHLLT